MRITCLAMLVCSAMTLACSAKSGQTRVTSIQEAAASEGGMALAPQTIGGAFLTCAIPAVTNTNDAMVFGCSAFDAQNQRLDLATVPVSWEVVDDDGRPVMKEALTDPGEFDQAWVIATQDGLLGLHGLAIVPVEGGKLATISGE